MSHTTLFTVHAAIEGLGGVLGLFGGGKALAGNSRAAPLDRMFAVCLLAMASVSYLLRGVDDAGTAVAVFGFLVVHLSQVYFQFPYAAAGLRRWRGAPAQLQPTSSLVLGTAIHTIFSYKFALWLSARGFFSSALPRLL